jgi:CHAT domain-containing protein
MVEFYIVPEGVIAFVLRSGKQEPVVVQMPVSQEQLQHCVKIYKREITSYHQHGNIGQRWQEIAEPLLLDILPHLKGVELVYLVPHGLLHHLPLHALQVSGDYLIDHFSVAYSPSAAVLNRLMRRESGRKRSKHPKAMVVGNPTLDIPFTESQALQIAKFFDVKPCLREEATKAKIQSELGHKDLVHLACHGFFDSTHPLLSGIKLAGGEILTAREVMNLTLRADLVTLSACETGRPDTSLAVCWSFIAGGQFVGSARLVYCLVDGTFLRELSSR